MKKLISAFLCFTLLFSFGVLAAAQEEDTAKKPTVYISAQNMYITEQTDSTVFNRRDALIVSVANVENFERCEIDITLNAQIYNKQVVPVIIDPNTSTMYNNCWTDLVTQKNSHLITLKAPIEKGNVPFVIYILSAEEDVPLEFTVNSVQLYTADGKIDQNDIVVDERRFNNGDFVQYDLNSDHKITAEDARQALRFAVGLDTATDAQCRAAGVYDADSFTSDLARFLLRAAVGLEGEVEKVVVQMEWVTDEETAYLLYHYSDGTYGTVGPMDGHRSSPDWF